MPLQPYRTSVTIDGKKFGAASTSVVLSTQTSSGNVPEMGSLNTSIRVWVNFHDDTNLPFGTIKSLFDLSNVVTKDKVKDMKIEFWKDDSQQDALCSYSFKGWISRFETSSVAANGGGAGGGASNHLLVLDLQPSIDAKNYSQLTFGN
jgi:hypothetical protein